jgi:hypothetical protein
VLKIGANFAFPGATTTLRITLDLQSLDHPPQERTVRVTMLFDGIDIGFFLE